MARASWCLPLPTSWKLVATLSLFHQIHHCQAHACGAMANGWPIRWVEQIRVHRRQGPSPWLSRLGKSDVVDGAEKPIEDRHAGLAVSGKILAPHHGRSHHHA